MVKIIANKRRKEKNTIFNFLGSLNLFQKGRFIFHGWKDINADVILQTKVNTFFISMYPCWDKTVLRR